MTGMGWFLIWPILKRRSQIISLLLLHILLLHMKLIGCEIETSGSWRVQAVPSGSPQQSTGGEVGGGFEKQGFLLAGYAARHRRRVAVCGWRVEGGTQVREFNTLPWSFFLLLAVFASLPVSV